MKTGQLQWTPNEGWVSYKSNDCEALSQLVLVFGNRDLMANSGYHASLAQKFPNAQIISCSTSGDILDAKIFTHSLTANALFLERTKTSVQTCVIHTGVESFEAGKKLAMSLNAPDLTYILIISDGNIVNGTDLVQGFNTIIDKKIPITGGLAGDDARFEQTLVGLNGNNIEGNIIAIGFYGNAFKVGHGTMGGWTAFGPERIITKSDKNILYEFDNTSALELYKKYLGDEADNLPGSALLFPLSIRLKDSDDVIVRTILSIDEEKQSMTFAGNIPEGAKAQLMFANFDKLLEGALMAADMTLDKIADSKPDFALAISCVGRKLILKNRIEEEVEELKSVLGQEVPIGGFYSNGEISPLLKNASCQLLNQTMTVTTYKEIL